MAVIIVPVTYNVKSLPQIAYCKRCSLWDLSHCKQAYKLFQQSNMVGYLCSKIIQFANSTMFTAKLVLIIQKMFTAKLVLLILLYKAMLSSWLDMCIASMRQIFNQKWLLRNKPRKLFDNCYSYFVMLELLSDLYSLHENMTFSHFERTNSKKIWWLVTCITIVISIGIQMFHQGQISSKQ